MPETHSTTVTSVVVLWALGIVCCAVGLILVYKAFACKRATNLGENRANVFPMRPGRTLSLIFGLTGIASGLGIIIMTILKR